MKGKGKGGGGINAHGCTHVYSSERFIIHVIIISDYMYLGKHVQVKKLVPRAIKGNVLNDVLQCYFN